METSDHVRVGRSRVVALLLALVSGGIGVAGLATADRGIERRSTVVAGVPLEVARPSGAAGRLPGVVVAHGLGASRQLMRGFADTLARRGYAVELVDLAGHGANTERLPGAGDEGASEARLDHDLDVAVGHLRTLTGVDGTRIGLLGHSMGAAAVLRYAAGHPAIRATVSISQGQTSVAGHPRDLLLLAGGLEFAGYREGALDALRTAYPQGNTGVTYGDPRAGTARRAVVVPGVEHVSVLFAPRTHREVASWFGASLGGATGPYEGGLRPVRRIGSALLLHLAALLCFGTIASAVLRRSARRPGPRRVPLLPALGVPAVAVVLAIPAMAVIPGGLLPIAIAAPVAGFFCVIGALTLAAGVLMRRGAAGGGVVESSDAGSGGGVGAVGHGGVGEGGGRGDGFGRAGTAGAAVVLVALTVLSFAVPAQLGWAHAIPVGPRAPALLPIAACTTAFFAGIETLCAGYGRPAANLLYAWTAAGALAGLGVAAAIGVISSFVLLIAPLLAGLLVWQGVQASALRALRAPVWLTALAGGVLLAWPIAVTMPIT